MYSETYECKTSMDDDGGFLPARENPRNFGYKPMPNDVASQKPLTPILDRFKALLKEKEDDIRVLAGADEDGVPLPPLTTDEIVNLYELVLAELTINSKPIITDLTIIAGEQREHGEGIADAICARIIEVPVEQKLPSLYLLDSIVKNIGRDYVRHFSARLPEVFCAAYRQVHPSLHPSMRHLFGTWSAVFPSLVLRKIESQLQFSPSLNQSSGSRASESPRPTHGIHVNPKYLEARRQLEHSAADSNIQQARGTSSTSKKHGNPPFGFDEYDLDNAEAISSQVGAQTCSSDRARTSFSLEAERRLPSSGANLGRSSSPFGIGHARPLAPPVDEFAAEESPRRVVEGASPSHPSFGYGIGSMTGRDETQRDWRRTQWHDGRIETSAAYSLANGIDTQRPRALIDAYGTDQRTSTTIQKLPKVKDLDITGIDSKVGVQTWRNTEEEEFEWEDMSPTLADRGRGTDSFSSSITFPGSSRGRPGFESQSSVPLETNIRRSHWSNQEQVPVVNESHVLSDNAVSTSDRALINKATGFRTEPAEIPVSHHPPEAWPRSQPWMAQGHFNLKGNGMKSQVPFLATSTANDQNPPLIDSFPGAEPQHRFSSSARLNFPSLNVMNPEAPTAFLPTSTGVWRPPINIQKSQPLSTVPSFPLHKQIRGQFDIMNATNALLNHGLNKSFLHQQQFDSTENKAPYQHLQFHNQLAGPISFNQQIPVPNTTFAPQFSLLQEVRHNSVPPSLVSNPSHQVMRPMHHGYTPQRYDPPVSTLLMNSIPGMQPSVPVFNVGNTSLHLPGVRLPPLPPGPPPSSSQMMSYSQNPGLVVPSPPPGGEFSGLISSLMAQGLIPFTNQTPTQDSVGLEFDLDILKVRHESAITALYADLPRQCTTCGLRFKSQEEHSSHMDWHLTKNRMSKNRKQKPSRKWFVSVSMWLSSAETLGTDVVPGFLLPSETVVETKDEEMAVPADEDQKVCALCGEAFDDFYSDETDEWMYRDAVYMNAPTGLTVGMDRSQLGPIVHAKCRSESTVVSPEDFGKNGREYEDEGSQRKRMRS